MAMGDIACGVNTNGVKRSLHGIMENGSPQKKMKKLLEDDDSDDGDNSDTSQIGGVSVTENTSFASGNGDLRINEKYALRFEHNKKREELDRLQEKYGHSTVPMRKRDRVETGYRSGDNSDSSSESEDDDGILALGALDAQVQNTLEAIRKKDPRVYDVNVKFYNDLNEELEGTSRSKIKQQKPLYLNDYHRKVLLEGADRAPDYDEAPQTYTQQQDNLKSSIVQELHATISSGEDSEGSNGNGFLVKKIRSATAHAEDVTTTRKPVTVDVETADEDPETYLMNFMSAKAWVPNEASRFQPFESDDEDDDRRAEEFEEAYNLRFEDPQASNEKLVSHARDTAAKYSVRKEALKPRRKARDAERTQREAEKQLCSEEKARLRKLKVAELEEKIQKIKDAAGARSDGFTGVEWSAFLNDAWDDKRWDEEMRKRFGNNYYEERDIGGDHEGPGNEMRKIKKPKWDEEIDINDLVPSFDETDPKMQFELTDGDEEFDRNENVDEANHANPNSRKAKLRQERDEKKEVRLERRKIEALVDEHLGVDEKLSNFGKKHAGAFHYRDTSPITHGLTANDILMADDSQLNQFAGLKKLAPFRDPDKKRKDKKHLGKKARLRQWRKETFGSEQGPQKTLADVLAGHRGGDAGPLTKGVYGDNTREGKKQRKRSRKAKTIAGSAP